MEGNDGGITFYVQNGKLCFAHNYVTIDYFYVTSENQIPEGHHFLSMEFTPTGKAEPLKGKGTPGNVTLMLDGKIIGKDNFPFTTTIRPGQGAQMLVGADIGSSVVPDYDPPFKFKGKLRKVIVDISGEYTVDHESELKIAVAKQ